MIDCVEVDDGEGGADQRPLQFQEGYHVEAGKYVLCVKIPRKK